MRIILDTNVLIAALISLNTPPDRIYKAWQAGQFSLVTAEIQLDELRLVSRREGVRLRIQPAEAGRMVNDIRSLGIMVGKLPVVDISPDPYDNFLLAMAEAARADLLVTGDKRGLLNLGSHRNTRIVTARVALDTLGG